MRVPAGLVALTLCGCGSEVDLSDARFPIPQIPWNPSTYVAHRTVDTVTVDGVLDELSWQRAEWTEAFTDIRGPSLPEPRFATRVKMLWDDDYFFVAADLEESHVWARLRQRDAVIYRDNDFEVFIDPDGDTHEYYELEINAFGTEWDLFLVRPYRDGGPALHAWDIPGLLSAVRVRGSLNDPRDVDHGWTVEIAFPWNALAEAARRRTPPADGDMWRVNFARVEWRTEVVDGVYLKTLDSAGGDTLPEDNWVWSPQGLVAMHYPEMWGMVRFSQTPPGEPGVVNISPAEALRARMYQVYYAQRRYHELTGGYASAIGSLGIAPPIPGLHLEATSGGYVASASTHGAIVVMIDETGRSRIVGPN